MASPRRYTGWKAAGIVGGLLCMGICPLWANPEPDDIPAGLIDPTRPLGFKPAMLPLPPLPAAVAMGEVTAAPPVVSQTPPPAPIPVVALKIESILYSTERRIAVVNNQVVQEGSTIAGYRVSAIGPNTVEFSKPHETRKEILSFDVSKSSG